MRFRFKMPLFRAPLTVYVGPVEMEAFAEACMMNEREAASLAEFHGCQAGTNIWLIKPKLELFAHEAHHYAAFVVSEVGVKDANREVEAYIMTWIMGTPWNKIVKGCK